MNSLANEYYISALRLSALMLKPELRCPERAEQLGLVEMVTLVSAVT